MTRSAYDDQRAQLDAELRTNAQLHAELAALRERLALFEQSAHDMNRCGICKREHYPTVQICGQCLDNDMNEQTRKARTEMEIDAQGVAKQVAKARIEGAREAWGLAQAEVGMVGGDFPSMTTRIYWDDARAAYRKAFGEEAP